MPPHKALVQTLDFFTPVVNDPYLLGRLRRYASDVYAMGGEPWTAMNIVCFPAKEMSQDILTAILKGGADKICEAGAVLVGGHSVEDDTIKYGLSVTLWMVKVLPVVAWKTNVLILTKPLVQIFGNSRKGRMGRFFSP